MIRRIEERLDQTGGKNSSVLHHRQAAADEEDGPHKARRTLEQRCRRSISVVSICSFPQPPSANTGWNIKVELPPGQLVLDINS